MRMKTMWAGLLSIAVLASCTQEEAVTTEGNNGNGEEKTWCTDVNMILPSVDGAGRVATRGVGDATNDGYADGEEYEYNVNPNECYFIFYDENRHRIGAVAGNGITWENPDGNKNDNVTRKGVVQLKSTVKPHFMVCVLNATPALRRELYKLTLDAFKQAQSWTDLQGNKEAMANNFARTGASGGFLMSNSSYWGAGKRRIQEVKVCDNVYQAGAKDPKPGPVDVYVERAVAKTTVAVNVDNKQTTADGSEWYPLTTYNENGTVEPDKVQFGVRFIGWSLNATNKSFALLKNIPEQPDAWDFSGYTSYVSDLGRSFWEEDGNYEANTSSYPLNTNFSGAVLDAANYPLNYYSLDDCKNEFGDNSPEYCFTNTFEGRLNTTYSAVTHVIIKAQYTDDAGKPVTADVYQLGKYIYTKDAILKLIKTYAKDYLKSGSTWEDSDFKLSNSTDSYEDRKDVKVIVKLTEDGKEKIDTEFADSADDNMNDLLLGDRTLWVFPKGECYYTIPIKYFANLGKESTGHYGVVRNHWYQINVTNISAFGHPTTPDKPIIPEPIEDDEWVLSCNINVLAWGKVAQDATVGGNENWQ